MERCRRECPCYPAVGDGITDDTAALQRSDIWAELRRLRAENAQLCAAGSSLNNTIARQVPRIEAAVARRDEGLEQLRDIVRELTDLDVARLDGRLYEALCAIRRRAVSATGGGEG